MKRWKHIAEFPDIMLNHEKEEKTSPTQSSKETMLNPFAYIYNFIFFNDDKSQLKPHTHTIFPRYGPAKLK